VASIVLFFYSVERSTDALDHRDPKPTSQANLKEIDAEDYTLSLFAFRWKTCSMPESSQVQARERLLSSHKS
jgi:hypothetical protein